MILLESPPLSHSHWPHTQVPRASHSTVLLGLSKYERRKMTINIFRVKTYKINKDQSHYNLDWSKIYHLKLLRASKDTTTQTMPSVAYAGFFSRDWFECRLWCDASPEEKKSQGGDSNNVFLPKKKVVSIFHKWGRGILAHDRLLGHASEPPPKKKMDPKGVFDPPPPPPPPPCMHVNVKKNVIGWFNSGMTWGMWFKVLLTPHSLCPSPLPPPGHTHRSCQTGRGHTHKPRRRRCPCRCSMGNSSPETAHEQAYRELGK